MFRLTALLVALVLVAAACVSQTVVDTTSPVVSGTTSQTEPPPPSAPETTTTVPTTPPTTAPDLSEVEGVSEEVLAQLEELISAAEEVRELAFMEPPTITVVTDEELESRVRESIEEDLEEIPADDALYTLLGLLDSQTDLDTLLLDLYGEQVAGFYDGENAEIVIPARQEGLTVLQQGTLVHELVHALTDQHFGFDAVYRSMLDSDTFDEASAYQALIEGDATLAELIWIQGLSQREIGEFIAESINTDTSAFDAAPPFVRDSLIFPYDTGLAFVQSLYTTGGWEAVNEAYSKLPSLPASTEQVITPDDYGRDLPEVVDLPTVDLAGYELERTSVWGEAGFRIMFDQILGEEASVTASDGWRGDAYHQWYDGTNAAFLLAVDGDTARDLEEMRQALVEYALTAIAEEDFVWVEEIDGLVYFIVADQVEVGETIREAIRGD